MRLNFLGLVFIAVLSVGSLQGQIIVNGEERFGNEWIDYDKEYIKILIEKDGLYRLTSADLSSAGLDISGTRMDQLQLFWLGEEVPIYTSAEGTMGSSDFIEFYGRKMRTEIDHNLFENADHMLNRETSLYSSTSGYFLTTSSSGDHSRIISVNNDLSGTLPQALEWYWQDDVYEMNDTFVKAFSTPTIGTSEIQFSKFESGEGFGSDISDGVNDFEVETSSVFDNQGIATLNYRITGNSSRDDHVVRVSWNGQEKSVLTFGKNAVVTDTILLALSDLQSSNDLMVHSQEVPGEITDRNSVGELSLSYPRVFDGNNQSFMAIRLEASSSPTLIEVENFDFGGEPPLLYNLDNHNRYVGDITSNTIRFLLPSVLQDEKFVLVAQSSVAKTSIRSIKKFTDLRSSDADFVIVSNEQLFDDGNGSNVVQEYADYRSSNAGGKYNVQIINSRELSDQFAYGTVLNPFSIKNWSNYAKGNYPNLNYVLLVGKSIKYSLLKESEENALLNLLPSFGSPVSDNFLFSQGHKISPNFAIGRVSARNPVDVSIYLDKLKTFDTQIKSGLQTIADKAWLKRIVHTTGGIGDQQKKDLKDPLDQMGNISRTGLMGGEVFSFHSVTNDPIEEVHASNEVFQVLNDGVMMKTYFGHGSAEAIQLNLFEDPSNLTNTDRYPVMTALGCYTGDAFGSSSSSLGEKNILADKRGAIIYTATSGLGYISQLNKYGQDWYNRVSNNLYGQPVGLAIQQSIQELEGSGSSRLLLEQLIVQGDPAVIMANFEGPDYISDYNSVSIDPSIITLENESFDVTFTSYNLGRRDTAISGDSIWYEFIQRLPNGSEFSTFLKDKSPDAPRQVQISLPNRGEASIGINTLIIKVDPFNQVEELPAPDAENNNELISDLGIVGVNYFVVAGGLRPVYPIEFAIVNQANETLKASTLDALASETTFVFELDTTEYFNSPIKRQSTVTQGGGVVEWTPGSLLPETAYYWRVSPDSTAASPNYIWSNSSFTYLPESTLGWNQGHYFQFLENDFESSVFVNENREFSFPVDKIPLFFSLDANLNGDDNWLNVATGVSLDLNPTNIGSLICILARHVTQGGIRNTGGLFGSINFTPGGLYPYDLSKKEDHTGIRDLLESLPDQAEVFVFTILQDTLADLNTDSWRADSLELGYNVVSILEGYGAKKINQMNSTGIIPYIFTFKKGVGPILEEIAPSIKDELRVETTFDFIRNPTGKHTSVLIGPANSWQNVHFVVNDIEESDIYSFEVYGLKNQNANPELINTIQSGEDLSGISAEEYPYLQLVMTGSDNTNRTPPQIDFWRITYIGLPDAAINPALNYSFISDTLQQGQTLSLSTQVSNISSISMDSLDFSYLITSLSDNKQLSYDKKEAELNGSSNYEIHFYQDTRDLSGPYNLSVIANPEPGQAELYRFNNLLSTTFYVEGDKIKPILDVTFDGLHILDGDLVSSSPLINIKLEDENKFFLLTDTAAFIMRFIYPDGSSVPLFFSSDQVDFIAANSSENNQASVRLSHDFIQDGNYTLVVDAQDRIGNPSGDISYKISFEVITKHSITHLLNYPNPFSTQTQFVYTLTGDQAPEFYKIQILTVSGNVVREITQDELGALKVGRHKTEYAWNGTDEYGDRLANGIYLYQFVYENTTDLIDFEHHDSSVDQYFKKDFGKMVLIK